MSTASTVDPTGPRIAVVGPGAIGTTIAAALHEAGRTPLLAGRTPRDGVRLHVGEDRIDVPGPVRTDPGGAEGPVDLVFLAVKATQTAAAAPWLSALCGPGTTICVLQNGVQQRDDLAALGFPDAVPSIVWFPAATAEDGSVRLLAAPRLTVPDGAVSQPVVDALDGSRVRVEPVSDFVSPAWRKLVQNAVAGLMAVSGRRAGVFAREDVAALALAYATECLTVARAEGAVLGDDTPAAVLDGFRRQDPDTGTSILADRLAGRPLEWRVRNDVVRRRARAHGIPTPISDVVVPLIAAASDGPG